MEMWFKGVQPREDIWRTVYADPRGNLGTFCPDMDECADFHEELLYKIREIDLIDGAGTKHHLVFSVNSGSADCNTGIFGRVFTSEGVWILFYGIAHGDCATSVKATNLALKRFVPIEGFDQSAKFPNIFYTEENLFESKSQIEYLCFAIGQLTLSWPDESYPEMVPRSTRCAITHRLLCVIQSKAQAENSLMWPIAIPTEILSMIASYAPAELPLYSRKCWKEYQKTKTLQNEIFTHCRGRSKGDSLSWASKMLPYSEQMNLHKQHQDSTFDSSLLAKSDIKIGMYNY